MRDNKFVLLLYQNCVFTSQLVNELYVRGQIIVNC